MVTVRVRTGDPDRDTLEGIAYAERQYLPDQKVLQQAAKQGPRSERREAQDQLIQLNPARRYNLNLGNGRIDAPSVNPLYPEGDPDFIWDGEVIDVGYDRH